MIRIEKMRKALESWLENCPCEICSKEEGTYLYLTPVSLRFRSVLSFLLILRNRSGDTNQLIIRLQNIIRQDNDQYDYRSTAPILCEDCARKAKLEINEEYRVAHPLVWVCEQCKKTWDPLQDLTRGAGIKIKGQLLCERCALGVLREQNIMEIRTQDKRKKKSNRDSNAAFLDEYLDDKTCEVCGSDEVSILTLQKTESSFAGTIGAWKHSCSPETFKQRLQTCKVICKQCLQENNN